MKVELLAVTPDAEKLIETAGRTAYQSKGSNTEKFVKMLVRHEHGSVIEHGSATFRISGASRAFTHQLVRHRLCSFTQQSQRYVNEKNFSYVIPKSIQDNPDARELFDNFMEESRKVYCKLQELGIRNEDARFALPNAVESVIIITANLREWRHIIWLRGQSDAQWEIRNMAIQVLKILKEKLPSVFYDLEVDEEKNVVVRKPEN
jgi:thymidylate synthase (FAD)